jgi:hypothetical protein
MTVARIEEETGIKQNAVVFPENYQRAIIAIAACVSVDECAEMSNKLAAIATYYKQAKNLTLEHQAIRIRTRARLRCRELLQELERDKRQEGRQRIGMSEGEYGLTGKAIKLEPMIRDKMIDAIPPAKITELALKACPPSPAFLERQHQRLLDHRYDGVWEFDEFCRLYDPLKEAYLVDPDDVKDRLAGVRRIEEWMHEFERHLVARQPSLGRR